MAELSNAENMGSGESSTHSHLLSNLLVCRKNKAIADRVEEESSIHCTVQEVPKCAKCGYTLWGAASNRWSTIDTSDSFKCSQCKNKYRFVYALRRIRIEKIARCITLVVITILVLPITFRADTHDPSFLERLSIAFGVVGTFMAWRLFTALSEFYPLPSDLKRPDISPLLESMGFNAARYVGETVAYIAIAFCIAGLTYLV